MLGVRSMEELGAIRQHPDFRLFRGSDINDVIPADDAPVSEWTWIVGVSKGSGRNVVEEPRLRVLHQPTPLPLFVLVVCNVAFVSYRVGDVATPNHLEDPATLRMRYETRTSKDGLKRRKGCSFRDCLLIGMRPGSGLLDYNPKRVGARSSMVRRNSHSHNWMSETDDFMAPNV